MTGATGGIGSKVARKLVKNGKLIFIWIFNLNINLWIGARLVTLVQDPGAIDRSI